jgi:hypothetical protein
MDRPPPLNVIPFGTEWIATNGMLAPDGTIRFPEVDTAEEVFIPNETPRADSTPSQPSAPSSES